MKTIKCIIQAADIHIRNYKRLDEYKNQLQKFINQCKEITSKYSDGEVRIVICGDLLHQKTQISNEQLLVVSWFLKELDAICTTIVMSGNHDLLESNKERVDSITPIFEMVDFQNTLYIDSLTGYKSACVEDAEDDSVVWVLYSIFDGYNRPDIEGAKIKYGGEKRFIGLFHGPIVGTSTDVGHVMTKGISPDIFKGCDFVLCGDIHKRQTLRVGGVELFYSGSLMQQNFGESVSSHGYNIINVTTKECTSVDIPTDYGFYAFKIDSFDDLQEGRERLINL